ncbi:hypothetical protein ACFOU2_25125 [Bacillus songklensis]|uniref:Lipoprotein n=1 Tax=Bacillus songklensis TaxID=1069116 RepID=A0ABV8BAR1_9BACI
MKSIQKMFVVSASLALLLSACGTTEQSTEKTNSGTEQVEKDTPQTEEKTVETSTEAPEKPETTETTEPKSEEGTKEEAKEEQPSVDGKERLLEQNLTYEENGKAVEKTGFLKMSDNQHYSMYVLDGYTLDEEEPGKDIVMSSEDQKAFMRIEIVPSDMDLKDVESVVKTTAEAISANAQKYEGFKQEGILKDAVWYKAQTEEDAVNLILIKGSTPMKLSIYTSKDQENIEPFLAMAQTIEVK